MKFLNGDTRLIRKIVYDDFQVFTLEGKPFDGITFKRSFLFISNPEIFLVFDSIFSEKEYQFEQRWWFGNECVLEEIPNFGVKINSDIKFQQFFDFDELNFSNSSGISEKEFLAGKKLYETTPSPKISTMSTGTEVKYLTIFSFESNNNYPEIVLKKSSIFRKEKEFHLSCDKSNFIFFLTDGGGIEI